MRLSFLVFVNGEDVANAAYKNGSYFSRAICDSFSHGVIAINRRGEDRCDEPSKGWFNLYYRGEKLILPCDKLIFFYHCFADSKAGLIEKIGF